MNFSSFFKSCIFSSVLTKLQVLRMWSNSRNIEFLWNRAEGYTSFEKLCLVSSSVSVKSQSRSCVIFYPGLRMDYAEVQLTACMYLWAAWTFPERDQDRGLSKATPVNGSLCLEGLAGWESSFCLSEDKRTFQLGLSQVWVKWLISCNSSEYTRRFQ